MTTGSGAGPSPATAPAGPAAASPAARSIVYLAPTLPRRSQTFVYQEILALRARGAAVRPVSVRHNLFMAEIEGRLGGVECLLGPGFARDLAAGLSIAPRRLVGVVRDLARGPFPTRGQAARTGVHALVGVALAGRLQREPAGYLHAHHAEMSTTIAMVAARLTGIPFGFTAHGSDVHSHPLLLAQKMASASVVVAASDFIRGSLLAVSPTSDVRVVRCPVPLDRFRPPESRTPSARLRLLHVGRLDGVKDQATLIEAVARAGVDGTDLELRIVGDGPRRGELEHLIAERGLGERVRLLGAVANDDLPALYRSADAFVMSSRREGLPVVLVEALASGLPVVATDVGGISELVREGLEGFLVPPGDPDALARAIARLDDPARRRQMGLNGVARARVHDLDAIARDLLDLFPVPAPEGADAASSDPGRPADEPGLSPPIGPPLPVSVLVLAHEGAEGLRRSLRSIARQRPRTPGEVVVVGPESARAAASEAGARHVAAPQDADDSALRARGAAECGESWVAFAEEGSEWLPGHLARLWERRHGRVAIAGTAVGPGAAVAPRPARRGATDLSERGGPEPGGPMPPLDAALVQRRILLEAALAGAVRKRDLWSLARRAGTVGLIPAPVVRMEGDADASPAGRGWRRPLPVAGDGGPSVAILPSARAERAAAERLMAGRPLLDLTSTRRPLLRLARRPTAAAFVGTTREALALRALGVRPLRPERGEEQTISSGGGRAASTEPGGRPAARASRRYAALRYSPAQAAYLRHAARRLTVLCYHGVDDPGRFSGHLDYLSRHFAPVSLADVSAAVLADRPLPRGALLITFDDGERSVLEDAAPMMHRRGIPGVAFVIGGLLDTQTPFWWREVEHLAREGGTTSVAGGSPAALVQALKRVPNPERLRAIDELRSTAAAPAPAVPQLRRDELPALEALGIAVASHTQTHPCLNRCDDDEIERELSLCRTVVSDALGHEDVAIAYPNGDWDERVLAIARRAGFRLGFQLGGRPIDLGRAAPRPDPLALHRVAVDSTASVDRLAVLASGLLPSALRGRSRLRSLQAGRWAPSAGMRGGR